MDHGVAKTLAQRTGPQFVWGVGAMARHNVFLLQRGIAEFASTTLARQALHVPVLPHVQYVA